MVWRFQTGGWVDAEPLIEDGTVYIGSRDGFLYALSAAGGAPVWKYDAGASVTGPAASAGGLIIAADLDGRVHAVERDAGSRKWMTAPESRIWGGVAADENAAFAAYDDGVVFAASLKDGSELWRFAASDAIYGGVAVSGGAVFVTSHDDWVYALDAKSGGVKWKREISRGSSTPAVANGLVIVGSWDERVYAMDADTGASVWNFWAGDSIVRGPTASENAVFFGADDGCAYSVSLEDGSLNWRRKIGEEVRSTPALDGGVLYIASGDTLFALDAANGAEVWSFETGGAAGARLAARDGAVYAGSRDETIYALAAGFPKGYAPPPAAAPTPTFQPLSRAEMREKLTEAFGSSSKLLGNAATFTSDSKTAYWRDASDLIIEVFENGYWLLTGRTIQQDGWEARYYSREDYERLANELGHPSLKSTLGWCCIRTGGDSRLQLVMSGERPRNAALATTAHEAGHALQGLLNPVQSKAYSESLIGALREAEAYTFEVALIRKIGEYAGVETARAPTGYRWDLYLARERDDMRSSTQDLSKEHYRGRLLMWQAVLHDPDLAHLRRELERNGRLSADSLMEMYYKFVSLTPSETAPYIESISTQAPLSDDLNYFAGAVGKRTNWGGIEYADLVLNALVLLTSP